MSVSSRLRSASCAASCSACRVADFHQRLFQPSRLGDVPKRDEHRRDGVGRARVGAGVQFERVARTGETDQVDFERPALAAHRAVEEGLAGLAFLGRHHVHQRGAEDLLQRLRAEHGQSGFVDGEEGAVLVDPGKDDRLAFEDCPEMWLRFDGQIDAHGWGPRSFAHGMAIGRKSREDYLFVPRARNGTRWHGSSQA